MQIQVILSIVAILGAAAAALLVDYLRNRNEQLRASMVEMKVRREEERRRASMPERRAVADAPVSVAAAPAAPAAPVAEEKTLVRSIAPVAELAPVADDTIRVRRRRVPPPAAVLAEEKEKEQDASKQALSDWLIQRAVARAAAKAAAESNESTGDVAAPVAVSANAAVEKGENKPPESQGTSEREAAATPIIIDESVWASLVSAKSSAEQGLGPSLELVKKSGSKREISLPAGFHDATILNRVADSIKAFTGLVVSIGATPADPESRQSQDPMPSIIRFVRGLMRENDFGCQMKPDEMLLVCPGETGINAQRRLNSLSEQLWDYQLRELSNLSIVFSLGGIDVQGEPLLDAMLSANERMQQTRRNRKAIMMPPRGRRVKVI